MADPLRVLLVEDSEDDALIILQTLKRGGFDPYSHRVEKVADLRLALEQEPWEIVISDYSMPEFDGLSALRAVLEKSLDIPFIMLSGKTGEEFAVEVMRAGAQDFILKGNLARLAPAVRRELKEAKERQAHRQAELNVRRQEIRLQSAESELEQRNILLKKAWEQTVSVLSMTSESKDPYTHGHQKRVAHLSVAIASEIEVPPDRVVGLNMAAMIHDLGKITIPGEILSKPGKLSMIEKELIKTHSQAGWNILNSVDLPWNVAEIVYQHHERQDGSGYPRGLKGEEILIEAKIIGVADVVEAMASHRPYRPALGIEKALEEIQLHSGTLYDPVVVDACIQVFHKHNFAFE